MRGLVFASQACQPGEGRFPLYSCVYMITAVMSCRVLDMQAVMLACLRALPSAGSKIEINSAMMPITTRSSTSVKARKSQFLLEKVGKFTLFNVREFWIRMVTARVGRLFCLSC